MTPLLQFIITTVLVVLVMWGAIKLIQFAAKRADRELEPVDDRSVAGMFDGPAMEDLYDDPEQADDDFEVVADTQVNDPANFISSTEPIVVKSGTTPAAKVVKNPAKKPLAEQQNNVGRAVRHAIASGKGNRDDKGRFVKGNTAKKKTK